LSPQNGIEIVQKSNGDPFIYYNHKMGKPPTTRLNISLHTTSIQEIQINSDGSFEDFLDEIAENLDISKELVRQLYQFYYTALDGTSKIFGAKLSFKGALSHAVNNELQIDVRPRENTEHEEGTTQGLIEATADPEHIILLGNA
jgi:hypothetical protein